MSKSDNLLSFTVASLRLNEMVKIAQYILDNNILDINDVKDADIIFSGMKSLTFEKTFYQLRKRIETLTTNQLYVLAEGDLVSQKQISFLSVCKCYSIISEFTIEVIRDKTLIYDYSINESDFITFINNKTEIYPKLENYSESTFNKAKQVMFLIFEQVGLIDNIKNKNIQHQILTPEVIRVIAEDNPDYLKLFLMPDADINTYR